MQTVVEGYTLSYIQSEVTLLGTKSDNDNNVVMLYWHWATILPCNLN